MDANPFDGSYDPKLMWFKSHNEKAPHHSRVVRLRIPEALYSAMKQYLVGNRQTGWIDPQGLLRPAIYHGLHHLGDTLRSRELLDMAQMYQQYEAVKEVLATIEAKNEAIQALRESERHARTHDQTQALRLELQKLILVEDDPEIKDELERILRRL